MEEQLAPNLWRRAPLWRYCCYAGAGLTILVAALPYLKQSENAKKEDLAPPRSVVNEVVSSNSPVTRQVIPEKPPQQLAQAAAHVSAPAPALKKKEKPAPVALAPAKLADEHAARSPAVADTVGNLPVKAAPGNPPSPPPASLGYSGDPAGILAELDTSPKELKDRCMSSQERVPTKSTTPGMTDVHIASEGLWCFFEPNNQLRSIRLEMPFAGTVGGVRIGDSLDKVKSVFGAPLRDFPFADKQAYVFNKNPGTFDRFDVSDGVVRTIFVGKR